jgi:hypothetical protein
MNQESCFCSNRWLSSCIDSLSEVNKKSTYLNGIWNVMIQHQCKMIRHKTEKRQSKMQVKCYWLHFKVSVMITESIVRRQIIATDEEMIRQRKSNRASNFMIVAMWGILWPTTGLKIKLRITRRKTLNRKAESKTSIRKKRGWYYWMVIQFDWWQQKWATTSGL